MRDRFSVTAGGRDGPRIALSLVHPRERIDIAPADVLSIEAVAGMSCVFPGGRTETFAAPAVELTLTPPIRARLYRLTAAIVGEAMDIVVCGKIVGSPIVREPLGTRPGFRISADDMTAAQALATKLRRGWSGPDLRLV